MDSTERAELGAAMTDEKRRSMVGALETEQAGYQARKAAAESRGDKDEASLMSGRIEQVQDQLDHYRTARETPEAAGTPQRRSRKAAANPK